VDRDVDRRISVFVHVTPETKLGKVIKPVSDNYNGRLISMETAGRVVDGRLKAYVRVNKGKNITEKTILFPFEAIRWDATIIYHEQCA
jgi:aminopeptidase C